jgi:hypothetical protein
VLLHAALETASTTKAKRERKETLEAVGFVFMPTHRKMPVRVA